MKGIKTFFFIPKYKVFNKKIKDVTYAHVACTIRKMKEVKHRTQIIVKGNIIKYKGDTRLPTTYLEIVKMLFNSILSGRKAKFMTINIANFYLMIPSDNYE